MKGGRRTRAAEKPKTGLSAHVAANRLAHAPDTGTGMEPDGGVNIFWLAKHFGLEVSTVRKRLSGCPALRRKTSGSIYLIAEAARYLVSPIVDVESYLAGLKPGEIPPTLSSAYWGGQLKRQEYMVAAGQLWRTESVIDVVGEMLKTIKTTAMLWTDALERETGLTDAQRELLVKQTDGLQDSLYRAFAAMAKQRRTPSERDEMHMDAPENDYAHLL